tara:strand:- start:15896 stop:20158 length:4263 start_codon:yes stop_codon:yes gene_type:complete
VFNKAKKYILNNKLGANKHTQFSEEFYKTVFNRDFYRCAYGNFLKGITPEEHFSKNFEKLEFDPCSSLHIKALSRNNEGGSLVTVLEKCASDAHFFSECKSISPAVYKHFQVTEHARIDKDIKMLKYLVDEAFYSECYPDIERSWLEPYIHYVLFGAKELRNPTASFNTSIYVKTYSDVLNSEINPFIHYFEFGKKEGRVKNVEEYEALKEKQVWLESVTSFDPTFYLENNPDVKDAGLDPLEHFKSFGEQEGRKPNPYFDPMFYLEKNPDVLSSKMTPFTHFCDFGVHEEREFCPEQVIKKSVEPSVEPAEVVFDTEYYLQNNPDIKQTEIDPLYHFINFGEQEGRQPNSYFSPTFYKKLNADVREAGTSAFEHFCAHGFYEGRLGSAPALEKRTNNKKPLLFVGHDGIQAGSEVVLLEIIKWFYSHTNRRIKVLLLSAGPLANLYAQYAEVYVLPNYKIDELETLLSFISEDFEFCYVNTVVSGKLFELLEEHEFVFTCDVIAHIHEMEKVIEENIGSFHYLNKQCKHFISASPATTKTLIEIHNLSKTIITTVPAFIKIVDPTLSNLETLKNKVRSELSIPNDALVVAGCGTVYWRKGPDIFLASARKVLAQQSDVHFVWFGPGPDLEELSLSLTESEKLNIHFTGQRDDANEAIAVADIFYMSSREDPFPLVVMEAAQHCIPTICFSEATGITEFVKDDAGVCLEKIDSSDAAKAILNLHRDRDLLVKMGKVARERVTTNYTSEKQCLNIYKVLQKYTQYKPSVSVIVPMYNHELFIDERIKTILNQTIKDIEVLVLDDCSKDKSVKNARAYSHDFRVSVEENIKNTGSPFAQWSKGLAVAKSDIVWIAEGDDTCDHNFIATLLPYFDDELVNIASGKTVIMNEKGEVNHSALEPYLNSAYPQKYLNSFIMDGYEEVNESFGAVCTLVNASGLLLRKSSLDTEILKQASSFKMCGDWLIYLASLRKGKLAYDVNTNNYFRRHSASVVNKVEGSNTYFNERYKVTEFVFDNYKVTPKLVRKAFSAIDREWERFKYKHNNKTLGDLYDKKSLKDKVTYQNQSKHIGFYVHGMLFSKGGIERLAADLSNYLVEQGYKVTIYARRWGKHSKSVYPLYESVQVKGIFDETRQEVSIQELRKSLLDDGIDVFIPMLSEWLFTPVVEAANFTGVPVIASEHNDPWKIEELWWNKEERLKCFESVDNIHLLLNKFRESLPSQLHNKVHIIPNGIEFPANFKPYNSRKKTIVAVGRLAEQKRFDRLIQAVSRIKEALLATEWHVEIYGEGHLRSELEELIDKLGVADLITLKGSTNDIESVLNRASIFVMPSEFEGFGIALVEAMASGLPSIAFKQCNGPNEIINSKSGLLVKSIEELGDGLAQMIKNDKQRSIMSKNARFASKQYEKETVFPKWVNMIKNVVGD